MFKLGYPTDLTNIAKAVEVANRLLSDQVFLKEVAKKLTFDMSTASGAHISALILRKSNIDVIVNLYYKRFSRALGYYNPGEYDQIYLNTKYYRSVESYVNSFIHEFIHLIDDLDETQSFGHGSNSPGGKQNTAPYWIGNLAEFHAVRLINAESSVKPIDPPKEPDFNNDVNSQIVVRLSFWQRVKRFFSRIF